MDTQGSRIISDGSKEPSHRRNKSFRNDKAW